MQWILQKGVDMTVKGDFWGMSKKYLEFITIVLAILVELHKKEIENHPAYKAFMKKLERASEGWNVPNAEHKSWAIITIAGIAEQA